MMIPKSLLIPAAATAVIFTPMLAADVPVEETPDVGVFSVYSENDCYFGGTDKYYTNGLKFSFVSAAVDKWKHRLPGFLEDGVDGVLAGRGDNVRCHVGTAIGQNLYSPVNIHTAEFQPDDRPYAAWLYWGLSFQSHEIFRGHEELDIIEFTVSVVGPEALGREAQNGWHDVIGVAHAEGWDNQLGFEVGVNVNYERRWKWMLMGRRTGMGFEAVPFAGGSIGNIHTYLNGGVLLRTGWRLPADFGANSIRPAGDTHVGDPGTRPFGIFLFGGAGGSIVLRNLFLDGNTFRDSHSVDKEAFVGDLCAGVGICWKVVRVTYTQFHRTKEFKKQKDSQQFGSIALGVVF